MNKYHVVWSCGSSLTQFKTWMCIRKENKKKEIFPEELHSGYFRLLCGVNHKSPASLIQLITSYLCSLCKMKGKTQSCRLQNCVTLWNKVVVPFKAEPWFWEVPTGESTCCLLSKTLGMAFCCRASFIDAWLLPKDLNREFSSCSCHLLPRDDA